MAANEMGVEVEAVKCYCCGLMEECTVSYIDGVRERYQGRWICGLCAEAVKEEAMKSQRDITTDEALKRHMNFRSSISSPPNKPTQDLIVAMKQLLFRSLDSPRKQQPLTFSPLGSCFSTKAEPQPQTRIVQARETG